MAENTGPSQERPSLPRVIDEHVESQRLDAIVRENPEPQALAEAIAEKRIHRKTLTSVATVLRVGIPTSLLALLRA